MFRFSLTTIAAIVLAGCAVPSANQRAESDLLQATPITNRANNGIGNLVTDATPGSPRHSDAAAALQATPQVAKRASRPWIGAEFIEVQSDEVLPPIFEEEQALNFDDVATSGRVSLAVVAERLTRITGVAVRVKQDVYDAQPAGRTSPSPTVPGGPAIVPLNAEMPAPLSPVLGQLGGFSSSVDLHNPVTTLNSLEMRWKGRLSGFLDLMTSRLGLSWSYRDGVVLIERYVTETFELAALVGDQSFSMSLQGGSGTSGGSSTSGSSSTSQSNFKVDETGKVEAFNSFMSSLQAMVAAIPGSSVTVNQGSGRFAVTTTKDLMTRIRHIVKSENESLQRQVRIQFDVYSVTTTNADERGVNWNAVLNTISSKWGGSFVSPSSLVGDTAGSVGLSILSAANGGNANSGTVQRFGNSSAVIQALSQLGTDVQHRPVELLAMNRQWARKTSLNDRFYVSETLPSTSTSAGSGSVGLKTSSVTTGDKFLVQPAILDNGTVLLKFGVSLTNLVQLFEVTAGEGESLQRVQNPDISGMDDQATVRLKAGQVLVLTGMGRYRTKTDKRRLGEGWSMISGGSDTTSRDREDFLIIVRPVITE